MNKFLFRTVPSDDPSMHDVYRLRYKVYCEEWGFERPEDHPHGLERDPFDAHSVHVAAFSTDSGAMIGTIRIILNSPLGFPLERHCSINRDLSGINRASLGEISRLAVSKDYRKRAEDRLIYSGNDTLGITEAQVSRERRRNEFAIITGLYTCMYRESLALGLTHWYAVMAKGLNTLLRRMGIDFRAVGPEINYHGARIPYLGTIDEIARSFFSLHQDLDEPHEPATEERCATNS